MNRIMMLGHVYVKYMQVQRKSQSLFSEARLLKVGIIRIRGGRNNRDRITGFIWKQLPL